MSPDDSVERIIAMRVEDLPIPPVPSRVDSCSTCGAPVWVSLRSPTGVEVVCTRCVPPEVASSVGIAPQTREELLDLGLSEEQIEDALQAARKALLRKRR